MKSLDNYHPRLSPSAGVETLSVRSFQTKYDGIQETQTDLVSVFGMLGVRFADGRGTDNVRKGPICPSPRLQIDVPRH